MKFAMDKAGISPQAALNISVRYKLTFGNLRDISDDGMINDGTINVFQNLIRTANPLSWSNFEI